MVDFIFLDMKLGIENENIVSKPEKKLALKLTKSQIEEKINKMYNTTSFNYGLINGFAYDTTIEWLRKNNKISTSNIDINSEVLTGRNSVKNVFDFFDNVFEVTRRNELRYCHNKRGFSRKV